MLLLCCSATQVFCHRL